MQSTDQASSEQPPTPDSPWYHAGLHFHCQGCGNCCTGAPGHVWVDDDEIERIARYLDKPVGEIRLLQTRPARGRISLTEHANGDCTFFDPRTRRCQIYPVRPQQCQTWPFWRSNLSTPESWDQVAVGCPGVGQGEFVSLAEIQFRAAQVDV